MTGVVYSLASQANKSAVRKKEKAMHKEEWRKLL
jgi:hypothetical protein